MTKLAPLAIAVFGYVAFLVGMVATYARLPERVASHFGANGVANGWMSRDGYVWFMVGAVTFTSLLLVGLCGSVRFLPASLVNIPRRDYWLAPERRDETGRVLARFGLLMAGLESLFFLAIHLLVVVANESNPVRLSNDVWWLLVAFLAATGGLTFKLYRRFS
ncbi:MAG: DUF1648 domain-containing protein [Planctomycetaceae bacterium]|uniref:DUF1648 domain-containing protein n=1 Tax=Lacipirellula limnantheis TaxID=2528024 RepID=A0A517U141_9BACT|nr:DUF1648 domain-containing protein [Lacipirellula limnantheis]MBL9162829.1 DUF1648 domain-containing protein [Planctomycetaceae bacterium]QDT74330.1 hypothetical protein I41_35250 [Lacipirellula limnantheis]